MNIFKNRAIKVSLVKDVESAAAPTPEDSSLTTEQITQIATDVTLKVIGGIGAVIAANRLLSTACEIAVIAAKAKLK